MFVEIVRLLIVFLATAAGYTLGRGSGAGLEDNGTIIGATLGACVGYVAGGISPVGQRRKHPTVLDQSALGFATILVSGGRRGFDLELAPTDLVAITSAVSATIGR